MLDKHYTNKGEAALFWFWFSFKVIPIIPDTKRTAVKWDDWLEGLSSEKITKYWERHPDHEVGFIVGEDIIVLDADSSESIAALAELEAKLGVKPKLIVKTAKGEHHYYRRAKGTAAKTDSHSTEEYPERIDVKTGRSMVILPPSTGKIILQQDAANASELTEVDQDFIDAVYQHNGREVPHQLVPASPLSVHSEPQSQVLAKINALLEHIDPDCGYEDWLHVLMAIFHETGGSEEGLKLADEWSSKGKKYKDSQEIKAKWCSFQLDTNNPITIATLKKMVSDSGKDMNTICRIAELGFKNLGIELQVIKPSKSSKDESKSSDNIKVSPNAKVATSSQTVASTNHVAVIPSRENLQPLDPLEYLQQKYALIKIGGRLWLLDIASLKLQPAESSAEGLKLYNRSDGGLLLTRALKAQFPQADATAIRKEFFVSPQTTCYEGVEFNPAGTSQNTLNLWMGPTVTPRPGKWELINTYLLEVICDGEQASCDYLLKFIAHALQKPWEKPGILIILIGGQGTGKGTLASILRRIWRATYLQIHNIDAVTGNFNGALERNFIVFMDEALFVGDRRASDSLKSLVTEPVIYINEKHQPARQSRSYHRFLAATNADHFKNTDRDDRRDFVLRVSDVHKGDHPYWQDLYNEIDNGGVEAMVHDLLAMDLSEFNVRDKPQTKELLEQKLKSLSLISRWWYNCLVDGEIDGGDTSWPDFIPTHAIISFSMNLSGNKVHRKPDTKDVANEMKKLCPGASKKQQQTGYNRTRGYSLPPLEQARAEFERYIGGKIDW